MIRRLIVLAALLVSISATAAENWTSIAAARDCPEVADTAAGAARPGPERETAGLYLAMSSAANRVARLPILSRGTTGGLRFWYAPDLALIREDLLAKRHLHLAELVGRMSMPRIYAGAHFRFSTGDGVTEGRSATTLVLKRVALPLD